MFALNDSEFFSYEHIAEIRLFHLGKKKKTPVEHTTVPQMS